MFERLCIIGVGLIGGSLARALRDAGLAGSIVGCGRGEQNLRRAVELGVIDDYTFDADEAALDADMIVVATSISATESVLRKIAPRINKNAVVTDVGSAKCGVINAARRALGPKFPQFVPGHPIAGTEKSGVEASFAELFREHRVILTPLEQTNAGALERVTQMWRGAGAEVVEMGAERHDEVLAATSHLPHMLAYAFVECLASMDVSTDVFDFAAGGFRDFSRIASSSPSMWTDIALDNRAALLLMLERFQTTFAQLQLALRRSDRDALERLFTRAKRARDTALGGTTKIS